jgi:hypothetical protein
VPYLNVIAEEYTEETSDWDPDDKWSRPSTHTAWNFSGIELVNEDGYKVEEVSFDVQPGDIVHALIAIYSTGDSFGVSEDGRYEVLGIFKSADLAFKNLKGINAREGKDFKLKIKMEGGKTFERYCPWDGYFESLSRLEVETFMVKDGRS